MRTFVVALVVAASLVAPGAARSDWFYPTDGSYMWWTPNQPTAGATCTFIYTGQGHACSGYNLFWLLGGYYSGQLGFTCPGTGRMYTAFQNDSAIRGAIWNNGSSSCDFFTYTGAEIAPGAYFFSCPAYPQTCYIKSSQYYWDGTSTVARAVGYT
jgi:hypothetical protein